MESQGEIGTVLDGRYRIDSTLGEGGFGVVYKATQLSTGQNVAIKVLHKDRLQTSKADVEIARFQREMELIAQLQHPNIVRLLDSGQTDDGRLFTVLELVQGQELSQEPPARGSCCVLFRSARILTRAVF